MNILISNLRAAAVATIVLAVVCCGAYPAVVWGFAQTLFPDKANGSLLVNRTGNVIGSRLIGQGFRAQRYFHPRPSAAGQGYDAVSSGGSNLGPTSRKLKELIQSRLETYRRVNGLKPTDPVPADAVTASGSGLDPHISPANAEQQVHRVAQARGLSPERVRELIRTNTDDAALGFLGSPGVHVLRLNLSLDSLQP